MLRTVVVALGIALVVAGLALLALGPHIFPAGAQMLFFGCLILLGTVFERRYRGKTAAAGAALEDTGERFVDPATGQLTQVLYDPKTGDRIYRTAK